ncbi:cell division inhibitor SulA [Pseudofulvimonas gallinarii]|uniref:Cell division inhibitor SulA n=2 Tax=Pseudofulvimonas gallinarii TaxID=634155 RepID=A0A4R3LBT5_9GAMM|nr:cell division inhibitor SulA [Pseudofulvimonas gallinarii]
MSASSVAAEHAAMADSSVLALPVRGDVWRGRRRTAPVPALPTGHAGLDALLPARGWPVGMLCEILHEGDGVGELRVVMPALAQLARQARPVIWIAPPYQPYAPALDAQGLPPAGQRVIQPDSDRQALWAAEQCLRAGSCAAVLLWPANLSITASRRLQLAAETGRGHGFVFRHRRHLVDASPAPIRLSVRRDHDSIRIHLDKCRGLLAPPAEEIAL